MKAILKNNSLDCSVSKQIKIDLEIKTRRIEDDSDRQLLREETRRETFGNISWGKSAAKNGLYLKNNETVACKFCRREFSAVENCIDRHREHVEECDFLSRKPVGNIPDGIDLDAKFTPDNALVPRYQTTYKRKHTFAEWPEAMKQQPEDLAEAGFYYKDQGDEVQCYYCGVAVSGWKLDDNEWKKHAYKSPNCKHVLACQGPRFVREAILEMRTKEKEEEEVEKMEVDMEVVNGNDGKLCKLCNVYEYAICMIPCGHVYSCGMCSFSDKTCAICRQPINTKLRLKYS